ncbi:hypothetical protein EsDP_00007174 [Epichloe bromicola]|uniref:Ribosomal protein L34 n=1 Tax=Epichloe bromicola TaxID=79588 RepID=A0ABQ0CZS9_9HYPO
MMINGRPASSSTTATKQPTSPEELMKDYIYDPSTVVRVFHRKTAPSLESTPTLPVSLEPAWHNHHFFVCCEPVPKMHVFSEACPELARHLMFRSHILENAEKGGEAVHQYNARKEATILIREILQERPVLLSDLTFTTLSPLRPSLTPLRRPNALTSFTPTPAASAAEAADVVSRSAVSSHPSLCGLQMRFGPRNTMNGHTRLVQKRRHGFLHRMRSRTGRKIIWRRRLKGRKQLAQ